MAPQTSPFQWALSTLGATPATAAPSADAKAPMSTSIVAHAAAEGGKIKMYSPEFYQACAIGGCARGVPNINQMIVRMHLGLCANPGGQTYLHVARCTHPSASHAHAPALPPVHSQHLVLRPDPHGCDAHGRGQVQHAD